jgi:ferredoxin
MISTDAPSIIQRFDQRDALAYRSQLIPGTKEYEIYYSLHPEFKEMDDKVRIHYNDGLAHELRLKRMPEDRISDAWITSTKKSVAYVLRDHVDGAINECRQEVEAADITFKIKELAKYLGAGIVGITRLNQAWVYSHRGHPGSGWGQPIVLNHKYAIVMGFPHTWDLWLSSSRPNIPSFMDDWQYYHLMSAAAVRLAASIRDMGYPAVAQIQSNYSCILPPLAVDSGLGEQCLIGICLSKEYGLAYRLCAVTTDLPLVADAPAQMGIEDFCSKCHKCVDACPSGALSKKEKVEVNGRLVWKQDVYKCFRYWNAMGVSCTICRRACPWSKPRTQTHRMVGSLAAHIPIIRKPLILADDIIYGKKPRYYPPPEWLRSQPIKMSLGQKLLYKFDHL